MKRILLLFLVFVGSMPITVSFGQAVTTIAGIGTAGYLADGGLAYTTQINAPYGIALDGSGNLYFADKANNRIRKINSCGIISTIAGTGVGSYSGDGGAATAATIYNPTGITLDASGNLLFCDAGNSCIRKIDMTSGIISLVAGTPGTLGNSGDGGSATFATINAPMGIVVDASGNIYFADNNNNRVRQISTSGIISNFAGTGTATYSGDGAAATLAGLNLPNGLAINSTTGDIYIADKFNNRIRKVTTAGIISTVVGTGVSGFSGDGGNATAAKLATPSGVYVDGSGNLYIADQGNNKIRFITSSGSISTIAGSSAGFSGDNGLATAAKFTAPYAICGSSSGTLYIADQNNNRIRKIYTNHVPSFSGGHHQTLSLCASSGADSINTLLAASDADCGNKNTWSVVGAALHGTLVASYNTVSTGCSNMVPTGLTYTPSNGYSGPDSFKVQVSDGIAFDTTTVVVTVNALPAVGTITGSTYVCPATTTTMTETVSGGTWSFSNSNLSFTVVNPTSISVSGVTNGIDTLIYTVAGTFCTSKISKVMVFNPYVGIITGVTSSTLCSGSTMQLFDSVSDGSWSSSNSSIATVSSSGLVTGVSGGAVTISYSVIACSGSFVFATTNLTVNTTPNSGTITGLSTWYLCSGSTATLSDAVPSGTWSATNSLASVAGGVVTAGATGGIDTILYTVTSGGCSSSASAIIVVAPYSGMISGSNIACSSGITTTTLSENVAGGTWSTSNANATITPFGSDSVAVQGVTNGTDTITYSITYAGGCAGTVYTTKVITINSAPVINPILGANYSVCPSSTITLADATLGGSWTRTPTTVATIAYVPGTDSLTLTGVSAGTVTVSYNYPFAGCAGLVTKAITVNPLPNVAAITGSSNTCYHYSNDTLSDVTLGGTWTSSSNAIATITPFGAGNSAVVYGVSTGTAVISYTVNNSCGSATISKSVVINSLPNKGTITGGFSVCQGRTITLIESTTGGAWVRSNSTASVSSGGIVTGLSGGFDTIGYRVSSTYCGADTAFHVVQVYPLPILGSITGSATVCVGTTDTLKDTTFSGFSIAPRWVSFHTDSATVSSTVDTFGIVTGVRPGHDTIAFILSNGCGSDTAIKVVTIYPHPSAGVILGDSVICTAGIDSLVDTTANIVGNWLRTNNNATTATIASTLNIATGVTAGKDTIMYYVHFTGCGYDTAKKVVNVKAKPIAGPITGSNSVCVFSTITLSDVSSGGTGAWASLHTDTATISPTSGVVHGYIPGHDSIRYIVSSPTPKCGADTQYLRITIIPLPSAGNITGHSSFCEGTHDTLSNLIFGGKWQVVNTNASIDTIAVSGHSTSVLTGVSAGVDTVRYVDTNACGNALATFVVTINPLPHAGVIAGPTHLCQFDTTHLIDTTTGGSWHSTNNYVFINTTGKIRCDSVGVDTIFYVKYNSCAHDTTPIHIITVSRLPKAGTITGINNLCKGSKITLVDTTSGGSWSHKYSTVTTLSVFDSSSTITGLVAGIDTIKYKYTNFCGSDSTTKVVTVNPLPIPPAISTHPASKVCLNTMYQNFGADSVQGIGEKYTWTVNNAELYATGSNRKYCLVNFTDTGKSIIKLSVTYTVTGCSASDSVIVKVDSANTAPISNVIYIAPEFFSLDNSAAKYQWGYDDAITKDSTLLVGEVNQNYYNPTPDTGHKYYWVITSYGTCYQKTYFKVPLNASIISVSGDLTMNLFPNPVTNNLSVNVSGANSFDKLEVVIYDVTGKELKSFLLENGKGEVSLSSLAVGTYIAVLHRDGFRVVSKTIIKN